MTDRGEAIFNEAFNRSQRSEMAMSTTLRKQFLSSVLASLVVLKGDPASGHVGLAHGGNPTSIDDGLLMAVKCCELLVIPEV